MAHLNHYSFAKPLALFEPIYRRLGAVRVMFKSCTTFDAHDSCLEL